jgi:hypothetical protein
MQFIFILFYIFFIESPREGRKNRLVTFKFESIVGIQIKKMVLPLFPPFDPLVGFVHLSASFQNLFPSFWPQIFVLKLKLQTTNVLFQTLIYNDNTTNLCTKYTTSSPV